MKSSTFCGKTLKQLTHLLRLAFDYVEKYVRWFSFLVLHQRKKVQCISDLHHVFLHTFQFSTWLFKFAMYNWWIHQRFCQSKEIWHNFWWQHQHKVKHSTKVRFTSFLSGGFITAIVVNATEKKLAKCTSVHSTSYLRVFHRNVSPKGISTKAFYVVLPTNEKT